MELSDAETGHFDHAELLAWMNTNFLNPKAYCAKRLTGHDTLANDLPGGTYLLPRHVFRALPALNRPHVENPSASLPLRIDSHDARAHTVRVTWFNDALRGGTQDVIRLTGFGDPTWALLDPENTGAIAMFVFLDDGSETTTECRVWVCRSVVEEDLLEQSLGPVEPGFPVPW